MDGTDHRLDLMARKAVELLEDMIGAMERAALLVDRGMDVDESCTSRHQLYLVPAASGCGSEGIACIVEADKCFHLLECAASELGFCLEETEKLVVSLPETEFNEKFDGIELSGSAILHLTQGSPQSVRLEAEDNILEAISTEVSNGVLHIGAERCIRNTRPINVYATAEKIESIAVSGSGSIIGTNTIASDDLRLAISGSGASDLDLSCRTLQTDIYGSGRAHLSGRAAEQSAQISGSGSILGYNLSTDRSDLILSGSGAAQVNVSKELSVDISGSGMVYYIGSPGTVKESITGSGKLERAR